MFLANDLPALYPIVSFGEAATASKDKQQAFTLAQVLLSVNATLFQIRYKGPNRTEFKDFATAVLRLRKDLGSASKIIINDDAELAKELAADGVHLGQEDTSTEYARKLLGDNAIIGLSTHTIEQVEAAADTSANYLGFGPIFSSKSKTGHAELCGLATLNKATLKANIPIVAIGGITRDEAEEIFANGASSAAVISDLHTDSLTKENISNLNVLYEKAKARKRLN